MELNENGYLDTAYSYGNERLSADRFEGSSYYYLYEGRGSVSAVTGTDGYFTASYRYNAYGEMTFGKPQYENVYDYNGESYNPNLDGQYLRARYYHVEAANFFTEDSYLGDIREPLSLNRYNYVYSSYLNYIDPSGHISIVDANRADKASFAELCEKKEFFNNLFDQFGFSSKISKLVNKLYEGIIEKYHNRSTANYQFFITLGSIVYSNKAWKLLGNMNSQNVNEKYMKHYGLTDEEVKKLYTHINLQHQGAKDGDSYDY